MKLYPESTTNPNVPKDVFIIAEIEVMSGELRYTYYADRDGWLWYVGDWATNTPQGAFLPTLYLLTGDTPTILYGRFLTWSRQTTKPGGLCNTE